MTKPDTPATPTQAAPPTPAHSAPADSDPIDRLNRALQRISFALDKSRKAEQRKSGNTQELVANVDALISRVRDALAHADRPEDK
ncbi:hypothetical protein [Acetobacter orleanensis]|uniref:hypothetical protein n=1 Tax=Acetobacter orleanensis TaxID=104099 RepID=UPI001FCD6154|nr:hypothetical protein [Acetobacter orleanensis]GBR23613.1 hypothetical protein AA0473_0421 [Acetobacter orleanensis NRIC 0473]